MNIQELKALLTPIVCDSNLTKSEISNRLGPIAAQFMDENPDIAMEVVFNVWNNTMADIVMKNGLGKSI